MIHAIHHVGPTGILQTYCGKRAQAQAKVLRGGPIAIGPERTMCPTCVEQRKLEVRIVTTDGEGSLDQPTACDDHGRPLGAVNDDHGLGAYSSDDGIGPTRDNSGLGPVRTPW